MLEVIDEEADRLNRFVEGLVELARIEAGQLELRRRWGTVDEIVMTALERAEPLTRRHAVQVSIQKDLPVLRVDAKSVAEVVYSLIDNAAKYSPTGTRIKITASQADEVMRLSVEDEGPGVPAELRERVFDKFFRAMRDGDTTAQPPGIGMGLAIARGIVEAHGGLIWIEDASWGKGASVTLTLPFGDDDERGAMRIEEPTVPEASDTRLDGGFDA
jgi:two-component system sensor histidine kinase KdpD